jgi:hypothetical protein
MPLTPSDATIRSLIYGNLPRILSANAVSFVDKPPEKVALMPNKVKVLYIAGCGRTGSTLLGNALGQIDGFVHVGELRELWGNLVSGRPSCGCGSPIPTCEMWASVLKEAYGNLEAWPVSENAKFLTSNTTLPAFLDAASPWNAQKLQRRLAKHLDKLERLYRAIQKVFNCDVIVDSSKRPMYMHKLQLIDAIDLRVVHLIRDPRSWAYAFLHKVAREGYVLYRKPFRSSREWNRRNWAFEVLSRQLRYRPLLARYEDFAANPRAILDRILNFVGSPSSSVLLQDEHTLNLNIQHTASGNPNRFKTGEIEIREDHGWETKMRIRDKMLVTAATWPLSIKYGYMALSARSSQTPDADAPHCKTKNNFLDSSRRTP